MDDKTVNIVIFYLGLLHHDVTWWSAAAAAARHGGTGEGLGHPAAAWQHGATRRRVRGPGREVVGMAPERMNRDHPWKLIAGKERDKLGTRSNEHGFEKTSIPRHRERRGLPCSSDGFRWRRETWPEKLAEPSSEVRRNGSCTWRTSARGGGSYERRLAIRVILLKPGRRGLRRHIYIVVGFGNFSEVLNFRIIIIPWIK
jgi:hypothetical protein